MTTLFPVVDYSPAMQQLLAHARLLMQQPLPLWIDGPVGSGRCTLATWLAQQWGGVPVYHCPHMPTSWQHPCLLVARAPVWQAILPADASALRRQRTLTMPALHQRVADIPYLAMQMVAAYNGQHGTHHQLNESQMNYLQRQPWPGELPALQLAVHQAIVSDV